MATVSVTNTFVSGEDALASEVNQNFDDLVTFTNSSVMHRDGSKTFTGDVDFGAHKATNMATPSASADGATKGYVDSVLPSALPKGVVVPYTGATAPSGWLLCDGSDVSRTTYADLFAVIGTTYGVGDGSTTFTLPDLRSKFIAGKGAAGWSDALGEAGGSADAVVVAHEHTFSGNTASDSHSHPYFNYGSNVTVGQSGSGVTIRNGGGVQDTSSDSHSHSYSGTTDSTGSSGTGANLPPYITLNHIIKV